MLISTISSFVPGLSLNGNRKMSKREVEYFSIPQMASSGPGGKAEAPLATVSRDGCSRIASRREGCDGGRADAPCPCFTGELILPCLEGCRRVAALRGVRFAGYAHERHHCNDGGCLKGDNPVAPPKSVASNFARRCSRRPGGSSSTHLPLSRSRIACAFGSCS